jgi:Uma2 family endonuclease
MTAAKPLPLMTPEEYLASEMASPVKREYVEGRVYVMSGARNAHNDIAINLVSAFRARVRGTGCRAISSDVKVRIRLGGQTRFYYPDAGITCQPNPRSDTFEDHPAVIAEVLSPSTRRIDEGEKRDAYLSIRSLQLYLLIEPGRPFVTAYRRTETGFTREEYQGMEAVIALPEPAAPLPLAEVYEDVELVPEEE